jgi:hypothetical protein
MTPTQDIFVANMSFATEVDGVPVTVLQGKTRVRAGHELLKANPQYFDPVDQGVHYDVEQTTAAPGEKRGGRRTAKTDGED